MSDVVRFTEALIESMRKVAETTGADMTEWDAATVPVFLHMRIFAMAWESAERIQVTE